MPHDIRAVFAADGLSAAFYDALLDDPARIPAGAVALQEADWLAFLQGGHRWDGARLVAYAPPVSPPAPTTVTGNQWAFALGDLGLATAWRAAVAKCKDKDQIRWGLVARDTPLLATDPLLARIAASAGLAADGSVLVDPAKVFAQALTEPT